MGMFDDVPMAGGQQQKSSGLFDDVPPVKKQSQPLPPVQGKGEYLGNKFTQSALLAGKGTNIVLGGIANALGFNEFGDRRFEDAVGMGKAAQDQQIGYGTDDARQSMPMRIAGGLVQAAPALGAAILNPALGVGMMSTNSMADAGDNIEQGLSLGATGKNFAVDTAGNLVGMYLPSGFGKTAKTIMVSSVPINAGQGYVTDYAKNKITGAENAELAQKYDPNNIEARVVDAAMGLAGGYGQVRQVRAAANAEVNRIAGVRADQARNFNKFSSEVAPYEAQVDAANLQAKAQAQDIVNQNIVPQQLSVADIIAGATGAPRNLETPEDAVRAAIEADVAMKKARGEIYQGELSKQIGLYGSELPPQYVDAPNSQQQHVNNVYAEQGLDPNSIAAAFERGRAGIDEGQLPQAQRDITQKQNNDALAKEAFDIANLRQQRADANLANGENISPDYVAGLAAHSGGTVNGDERAVYMVGERQFFPEVDGRTGEPIITETGDMYGRFVDSNGNETQGTIKQKYVEQFTSPANPRQAQDFMAQSTQPKDGVGEGTMAREKMPRRSTDRISGDVYGGRAYPTTFTEERAPSGDVTVEQAPKRPLLTSPRKTDTVDNEASNRTDIAPVDGEGVRTPFDRQPDNTPRITNQTGGSDRALPSPDNSVPNSNRVDPNGNVRGETYDERGVRQENQRKQDIVTDYSRNELGNTARTVGRTDTSIPVKDSDPTPQPKPQKPKHTVDDRLNDEGYQGVLKSYADGAGWATEGGKLLRDENGDVKGRTTWEGKESWWHSAPKALRAGNGKFFRDAVNKSLTGGKLSKSEKDAVKWALDHADAEIRDADARALGKELGFIPYVLEGRKVKVDVDVGGKKVTVEQDATTALLEAKSRIKSLTELLDCLG